MCKIHKEERLVTFDENCETFKIHKIDVAPVGSSKEHMIILEQVGQGCVSGHFAEWPQLKPACKWAVEEILQLRREIERMII